MYRTYTTYITYNAVYRLYMYIYIYVHAYVCRDDASFPHQKWYIFFHSYVTVYQRVYPSIPQ